MNLEGKLDSEWIPTLKGQGWIVVTTDRGKKNWRGKLPLLCQRNGVTYIMLSAALHKRKTVDKLRALITAWPEVVRVASEPPGGGYLLQVKNNGMGVTLQKLTEPIDATAGDAVRVQTSFLGRKLRTAARRDPLEESAGTGGRLNCVSFQAISLQVPIP